MFFIIDPGFFATIIAFIAIKVALETIRNASPFVILLLLLPVIQTIYKFAFRSITPSPSTSPSPSPPPQPTHDASHDSPISTTTYRALLQGLAPALDAIETCVRQLHDGAELREELSGRARLHASASRAMLTMMCGRMSDELVANARELRALEELVGRGLATAEEASANARWTARADGIEAAVARQLRDADQMYALLATNDVRLGEALEILSADTRGLRAQVAEEKGLLRAELAGKAAAAAAALATLEQRVAGCEAGEATKASLEALEQRLASFEADRAAETLEVLSADGKGLRAELADKADAAALTMLEQRFVSLEDEIANKASLTTIEQRLASFEDDRVTKDSVTTLEQRVASFEDNRATKDSLTTLEQRLTSVETDKADKASLTKEEERVNNFARNVTIKLTGVQATKASLTKLEQHVASFEADHTLRLDALSNVTETLQVRDRKIQEEVQSVKSQLSSTQDLHRKEVDECKAQVSSTQEQTRKAVDECKAAFELNCKAFDECKAAFDKAAKDQPKALGEKCDRVEQETARLRKEASALQDKLRESEFRSKRALEDQKVASEQALKERTDNMGQWWAKQRTEDLRLVVKETRSVVEDMNDVLAKLEDGHLAELDRSIEALTGTQRRHEEALKSLQAASGEDDDDDRQGEQEGSVANEAGDATVATKKKKKNRRKKRVAKGGAPSTADDSTANTTASSTATGEQPAEDADSTQDTTHGGQVDTTASHIEPTDDETATTAYTATGEQHTEDADSTQMACDGRSDNTDTLLTDHTPTATVAVAPGPAQESSSRTAPPEAEVVESSSSPAPHETKVEESGSHPVPSEAKLVESSSHPAPHETEVGESSSHPSAPLPSSSPVQSHSESSHTSDADDVTDENLSAIDALFASLTTAKQQGSSSAASQPQDALQTAEQPEAQGGKNAGGSTQKQGKKKNRRKMQRKSKK